MTIDEAVKAAKEAAVVAGLTRKIWHKASSVLKTATDVEAETMKAWGVAWDVWDKAQCEVTRLQQERDAALPEDECAECGSLKYRWHVTLDTLGEIPNSPDKIRNVVPIAILVCEGCDKIRRMVEEVEVNNMLNRIAKEKV